MTAKAEPRRAKGPDNNKRLAELEAKEAASKAINGDKVIPTGEAIADENPMASLSADYSAEQELGRRSKAASIARDQAPFGAGGQLDAWLEGWDG